MHSIIAWKVESRSSDKFTWKCQKYQANSKSALSFSVCHTLLVLVHLWQSILTPAGLILNNLLNNKGWYWMPPPKKKLWLYQSFPPVFPSQSLEPFPSVREWGHGFGTGFRVGVGMNSRENPRWPYWTEALVEKNPILPDQRKPHGSPLELKTFRPEARRRLAPPPPPGITGGWDRGACCLEMSPVSQTDYFLPKAVARRKLWATCLGNGLWQNLENLLLVNYDFQNHSPSMPSGDFRNCSPEGLELF